MLPDFSCTVAALTRSIVEERCGPGAPPALVGNAVAQFVIAQQQRMPDFLRRPIKLLTWLFDIWPVPFSGRTFHRLTHARRWRQIQKWKTSSLGFRRDFVRFYESLIVFGWHAETYGTGKP